MPSLQARFIALMFVSLLPLAVAQPFFGDLRNMVDRDSKTHTRWTPPRSLQAWTARRTELRAQVLAAAGLHPMPERTPLRARRFGKIVHPTYTVEKVVIETMPGLEVSGNLYRPAKAPRLIPAVLVAHGHWKHGRIHNADDYSVPALCVNLASQGFAVFSWDMLGYNTTRALPHVFGDSQEEMLWSFSPLGIQIWNAIRAIDFVESLDFVNRRRIGMTGASGGGTQTFLTAAVDDRILAAAPVDMVSAGFQGDDACEIAPSLRLGSNNVEIAALIAPRDLMLISSTKDWTRNTPQEEFPLLQAVYGLYQRPQSLQQVQIDAPHNYNRDSRQAAYGFFAQTLLRRRSQRTGTTPSVPLAEKIEVDFDTSVLLGTEAEGFALQKQDKRTIFANWKSMTAPVAAHLPDEVWRESLEAASGIRWPEDTHVMQVSRYTVLTRACCGDRIPIELTPGKEKTVIGVHEDGMDSLRKGKPQQPSSHLFLDLFQMGSSATARGPFRGDHLTFHMSDDANRVQDLLTAIAYVAQEEKRVEIDLECSGARVVPLCHIAAALSRIPVRLTTDGSTPKPVFIPGLARLGGMEAVEKRRNRLPELTPSAHPTN